MKIHLDFTGIPILYKTLQKRKEIDVDLAVPRCTLRDLVGFLVKRYGVEMKKALLDREGDIDLEIRVMQNNTTYLVEDRMLAALSDGDLLAFRGAT